ncbi:MAG TPA: aspartate kinase [Blastocatellia bacterium]|nr:aspartate kinase [Blastocatellia bacterium]
MIVMKFGGTSVEDAPSIERVAGIIRSRLACRPVVVVSAMGKTTRALLDAAESSAAGDSARARSIVSEVKARHSTEAGRLIRDAATSPTLTAVERYIDELNKLLEGLAILGEVPPRGLDKILSYGELLSSAIVAGALAEQGLPVRLMDSRQFIKTDARYGSASPLFEITNAAVREVLLPVIDSGEVPIVQGFIGSASNGSTTTLGFEGSDFSAAIIGAAMDAEDIQIWKDVSGLMTADPAIFGGARTVKQCTFAEAAELTYFGAKVLHPKAIHPAAEKKIPVHICNSRRPDAAGTAITTTSFRCSNVVKSITYKRPVTVISSTAHAVPGLSGSERRLLKLLIDGVAPGQNGLTPMIAALSASRAVFAIDSSQFERDGARGLIDEMAGRGQIEITDERAIVSLVGEDLRSDRTMASRVLKVLDDVDVGLVLHGSSPITMNLIVGAADVESVVAKLHDAFFADVDPDVFE